MRNKCSSKRGLDSSANFHLAEGNLDTSKILLYHRNRSWVAKVGRIAKNRKASNVKQLFLSRRQWLLRSWNRIPKEAGLPSELVHKFVTTQYSGIWILRNIWKYGAHVRIIHKNKRKSYSFVSYLYYGILHALTSDYLILFIVSIMHTSFPTGRLESFFSIFSFFGKILIKNARKSKLLNLFCYDWDAQSILASLHRST